MVVEKLIIVVEKLFAALLPVAVLLWLVYRKDALQPEPKRMILAAVLYGVLSAFLSFAISTPLIIIHETFWGAEIGPFYKSFFLAAVSEEVAKMACLLFFLSRNNHFDEYVDGIVYAASVSLGFAGIENILYVFEASADSWTVLALSRALLSIPGHCLFAIPMGYCLALVWFVKKWKYAPWAILLPILAHGLYDYIIFASAGHEILQIFVTPALFLLLFFLYKKSLAMIDSHLRKDLADQAYAYEAQKIYERYVPRDN